MGNPSGLCGTAVPKFLRFGVLGSCRLLSINRIELRTMLSLEHMETITRVMMVTW